MQIYKVQKGDTLGKIARRFYGDAGRFPLIVAANAITNPDRLAVGQALNIPDGAAATAGPAAAPTAPAPPTAPSPPPVSAPPDRTRQLSEQRLGQVHPVLATRARSLIDLCAHAGVTLMVTQGLRTWEEQDALYAKGRTVPPIGKQYVVTMAKGGQSFHNFGLAIDVVVLDSAGKSDWDATHPGWALAGQLGGSVGLEWGGSWKTFKDLPHFQYTGGLSLADCRELHPLGLPGIWERVK